MTVHSRGFGVLLHPTALPGPGGIGELGAEAIFFLDILHAMGASMWQVLPLHPTAYGNSPYSADSAFAGNPLLISSHLLVETGLLDTDDLPKESDNSHRVDFSTVRQDKKRLLEKAFKRFQRSGGLLSVDFKRFVQHSNIWLDDYARFRICKYLNEETPWYTWDDELKFRDSQTMERICAKHTDLFNYVRFVQFIFHEQWLSLKAVANNHGIQIIGDMPIFVAHDSVDVWTHPDLFLLNETLDPVKVAGVPPDYFSETGQLWGNPLYHWSNHEKSGFKWWQDRFDHLLSTVDSVRIDHFRGFEKYWAVPASETTAVNGQWETGPGKPLFHAISSHQKPLNIIAEDLGVITPEVEKLRDDLMFPGMKILQFAFGSGPANPYLPHNHVTNCVVYTGTHDNDTSAGWWNNLPDAERINVKTQISQIQGHPVDDIVDDLIRMCLGSTAQRAILPVQDILKRDSSARFNLPGTSEGNWEWRMGSFTDLETQIQPIRQLALEFNRIPPAGSY